MGAIDGGHLEVFTKRTLAGGQSGYALASTELLLQTLLDEHDFTAASLLLRHAASTSQWRGTSPICKRRT